MSEQWSIKFKKKTIVIVQKKCSLKYSLVDCSLVYLKGGVCVNIFLRAKWGRKLRKLNIFSSKLCFSKIWWYSCNLAIMLFGEKSSLANNQHSFSEILILNLFCICSFILWWKVTHMPGRCMEVKGHLLGVIVFFHNMGTRDWV